MIILYFRDNFIDNLNYLCKIDPSLSDEEKVLLRNKTDIGLEYKEIKSSLTSEDNKISTFLIVHSLFDPLKKLSISFSKDDFIRACTCSSIEIIKYIDSFSSNMQYLLEGFYEACKHNKLEVVQYLYSKNINLHEIRSNIEVEKTDIDGNIGQYSFLIACVNDNLEVAKWLITLKNEKLSFVDIHTMFVLSFDEGNLLFFAFIIDIYQE